MSLILDALNRADRERKDRELTPDINTVHDITYHPGTMPRSRKILIVVVGLLCLAVMVLMYALIQNRNSVDVAPDTRHVAINQRPAQPQATQRPKYQAPSPPVNDQQGVKVEATPAPVITNTASSAAASSKPSAEVTSLYADSEEEKVADVNTKVSDLYKPVEELPEPKSVPIESQPITPVSLLESAEPEVETGTAQSNVSTTTYESLANIPDLRELPWGLQQQIPSIMYSKHNFMAGNVVINNKQRRAGTDVAPQLRLEEIFIDGVRMRFRDQTFKLRALNNWVNM